MSLRIAITGATGLVGSKLVPFLLREHCEVTQITRRHSLEGKVQTPFIVWDPEAGQLPASSLEGFDAVIHLAGANVGQRWDEGYKKTILDSRVKGTRLVSTTLAQLQKKPKVLLSASAVGYYGDRPPGEVLDEFSMAGKGFLADVCKRWEEETMPARDAGIRVVNLRFGVVLSKAGGALGKMWLPFQLGIGGPLGSGEQMMSWVAIDEIPFIIRYVLNTETISGSVNVVAPKPVPNHEFTRTLGEVMHRPTFFSVPTFMIQLMFGEMGETVLLGGSRVLPHRLLDSGYRFHWPDLRSALQKVVE